MKETLPSKHRKGGAEDDDDNRHQVPNYLPNANGKLERGGGGGQKTGMRKRVIKRLSLLFTAFVKELDLRIATAHVKFHLHLE